MEKTIEFTGCKHLDFGKKVSAVKNEISTGAGRPAKICWNRPQKPSLVQFCKHRGRYENPLACLCEKAAMCSDYLEFNHVVTFDNEA